MNVELEMSTARRNDILPWSVQIQGVDLDAVDHALDHGDLETVRRLLGLSRHAWRLVLASL
jgi:hypothetical protein